AAVKNRFIVSAAPSTASESEHVRPGSAPAPDAESHCAFLLSFGTVATSLSMAESNVSSPGNPNHLWRMIPRWSTTKRVGHPWTLNWLAMGPLVSPPSHHDRQVIFSSSMRLWSLSLSPSLLTPSRT